MGARGEGLPAIRDFAGIMPVVSVESAGSVDEVLVPEVPLLVSPPPLPPPPLQQEVRWDDAVSVKSAASAGEVAMQQSINGLQEQLSVLLEVRLELKHIREAQRQHEATLDTIRGQIQGLPEKVGAWVQQSTAPPVLHIPDGLVGHGPETKQHLLRCKSAFGAVLTNERGTLGSLRVQGSARQPGVPERRTLPSTLSTRSQDSSGKSSSSSSSSSDSDGEDMALNMSGSESVKDPRAVPEPAPAAAKASTVGEAPPTARDTQHASRVMQETMPPRVAHEAHSGGDLVVTQTSSMDPVRVRTSASSIRTTLIQAVQAQHTIRCMPTLPARTATRRQAITEAVRLQLVADCRQASLTKSTGVYNLTSSRQDYLPPSSSRWRWCVIRPNSHSRLMWDAIMIAGICLTLVVEPVGLVYLDDRVLIDGSTLGWTLHFADAVWFVNILLNFITGYYEEGRLITDVCAIGKRYARTWLLVDLISVYPFFLAHSFAFLSVLIGMKLTRFLRILQLFSVLQHEYRSTMLFPVKVGVTIMLILHVWACAWRLAQGRASKEDYSVTDLYVCDLYWVLMTVTTIGYGDITPKDTTSRIFACFAMVMSPLFFGTIVSGLTHVSETLFKDPIQSKIAEATRFMTRRGVTPALQRRVEHNLRQHLQQEKSSAMDPELFNQLSPYIQRDLALELVSSTVLQFPLFQTAPYGFIGELATKFLWLLCMSGDVVVEEGQLIQEAHFVMRGRLYIESAFPDALRKHRPVTPGEEGITEEDFSPLEFSVGAWFGEACFFRASATHYFSATAQVDTEMATLGEGDYHRIAKQYPRVAQQQRALEKALEEQRANLDQLAYKVPDSQVSKRRLSISALFQFSNTGAAKVRDSIFGFTDSVS